jgi:two-component system, NtrC family, response regulator HydG
MAAVIHVCPMSTDNGKSTARLLLIDDDLDVLDLLTAFFKPKGFRTTAMDSPEKALEHFAKNRNIDLVISDWKFLGMDGIELIQKLKEIEPTLPIILITSKNSSELAVTAVEAGAYDFLLKPLNFPQLMISVHRALHWRSLLRENQTLREVATGGTGLENVVFKSARFKTVMDLCRRVANSQATVLITGESGTGKEVVARAIHKFSGRANRPFVAINCSAIPETLLESELFGYNKGAFTGANDKKIGLFEEANGGTLFLDEIGDLSLALQAKLLRVLQERKIKRLGENQLREVDVRILAATHKNLGVEVKEKRFREDLFFRLNVIPVRIPPLRERKEDILPLAEYFLRKYAALNKRQVSGFSRDTIGFLLSNIWTGNVRELENVVERAVVLASGPEIMRTEMLLTDEQAGENLPLDTPISSDIPLRPAAEIGEGGGSGGTTPIQFHEVRPLDEIVREYILFALKKNDGAREVTAKALGVDRKTLYRKLKELESASQQLN